MVTAIPLGGFVRMLGEQEPGEVPLAVPLRPDDKDYSQLSVAWRLSSRLAGPAANFLLTIIIYWVVVHRRYPCHRAHARRCGPGFGAGPGRACPVLRNRSRVDGARTQDWQQVNLALADRLGETGSIVIEARQPGAETQRYDIPISDWHQGEKDPNLLGSLGFTAASPALVGEVLPGGAGERDGLEAWDLITAVDGEPVAKLG